ncbi:MAG: 3-oxoacyl-[acyl-carrier-protein] synthase III C-terminal domain-containing protein [Pseudomonadota bacterium]
MTSDPRLLSLATAVPPYRLSQGEVAAMAPQLFSRRQSEIDRLMPVYDNAGIATRYSCVPAEWYLKASNWRARNALYLDNALDLIQAAADRALNAADLAPDQIDTLVTVSTTGIATPSLDARLMDRMAFRRDLQRLPVFGLGCAGGVLGLARAAALARAAPGSRVLILVVELCGLTFRNGDQAKSNIIASALFGDGAAAAVLTCDTRQAGPSLTAWGEHTWPNSLEVMGWHVEDDGLGVVFSRDIPTILRQRFGAALDRFLARQALTRSDIAGYVCHPGGTKVIEALEEVLGLAPGAMTLARGVLQDYGNMSAASLLFVLERALVQGLSGRQLLTALGPGFTAGFLLLEAEP